MTHRGMCSSRAGFATEMREQLATKARFSFIEDVFSLPAESKQVGEGRLPISSATIGEIKRRVPLRCGGSTVTWVSEGVSKQGNHPKASRPGGKTGFFDRAGVRGEPSSGRGPSSSEDRMLANHGGPGRWW